MKLVLFVLFFLISCQEEIKSDFSTTAVKRADINDEINLSGRLKPLQEKVILAPDDLTAFKLKVEKGSKVKEGDLLLKLDPSKALKAVEVEKMKLFRAENNLKTVMIRLRSLKSDLLKSRRLYSVGAVSKEEKESKEQSYNIQSTEIENIKSEVKAIEDSIVQLKKKATLLKIKAPFSGVIEYSWKDLTSFVSGASVNKGDTLFRISSEGDMYLNTLLREGDVRYFTAGQKFKVNVRALDKNLQGTVLSVDNVANINDSTGVATYKMKVQVPGGAGLKTGMEGTIKFIKQSKKNVLVVPRSAVNPLSVDDYEVKLVTGSNVESKKIKTGISDEVNIEVVSGLNPGEKVLTLYE